MRHLFWVLPVAICLVICGCAVSETPPTPLVTTDAGVSVPVRLGTYGWTTRSHGIQSDAPVPDEFAATMAPVSVPPGSALTVHYGYEPCELYACLWHDHKPTRVETTGGSLQVPEASGTYVYSLEATWREGHASHVLSVTITPE